LAAARPSYSVLGSKQGDMLPSVEDRLERCVAEVMNNMRNAPEEAIAVAS
jgi:hypothetical protein